MEAKDIAALITETGKADDGLGGVQYELKIHLINEKFHGKVYGNVETQGDVFYAVFVNYWDELEDKEFPTFLEAENFVKAKMIEEGLNYFTLAQK